MHSHKHVHTHLGTRTRTLNQVETHSVRRITFFTFFGHTPLEDISEEAHHFFTVLGRHLPLKAVHLVHVHLHTHASARAQTQTHTHMHANTPTRTQTRTLRNTFGEIYTICNM
jgi:hypothetical protein